MHLMTARKRVPEVLTKNISPATDLAYILGKEVLTFSEETEGMCLTISIRIAEGSSITVQNN